MIQTTKEEAIATLTGLNLRLSTVSDSYDKETDMQAIEMGIMALEVCIELSELE